MDFYLEKELQNVKVIDTKRDYWFIRSYSGQLFDDFLEKGYVGLGFNHVPYQYIKDALNPENRSFDALQRFIEENTDYKSREATKWSNQLISFEHEVKVGDLVITPSKNSSRFAFGIVKSNTYLEKNPSAFKFKGQFEAYPEKRRKIDWLKIMSRDALQGELRNLMSNHQAITLANDYSDVIEGNLTSLYIKDERVFLTIRVNQDEDINAFDLNRFLTSITYFYKEFCKEYGIEENEDLTIKIKLQSRGKVAFQAFSALAVLGVVGVFALSDNPEIGGKYDPATKQVEFAIKSDGFLQSISNFLDSKQERQIEFQNFLDSKKKLEVKPIVEGIEDDSTKVDTISVENRKDTTTIQIEHKGSGEEK